MKGPEDQYIQNLDEQIPAGAGVDSVGFQAEDVVISFLTAHFPNISVRPATPEEDSGATQITKGKQVDAVVYLEDKPAMVIQITTAESPKGRNAKIAQMRDKPFVRLDEMGSRDSAVPKVLVHIHPNHVRSFLDSPDFTTHPEIVDEITRGIVNSLQFDLVTTHNPTQQNAVRTLLDIFDSKKASPN